MAKKKYTAKVLENYKKIIVSELKKELNKPGSNLEKSIVGRKIPKRDGFVISMNEYGLNVDRGRSAGKFPPIEKINDWIERKGIKPKTLRSGKTPTLKQLSFLIGRSIAQKGIRPHRFIDVVIDKFEARMTMDLVDAYRREIQEEIDAATPTAKKS
jgi:hypothetical protein